MRPRNARKRFYNLSVARKHKKAANDRATLSAARYIAVATQLPFMIVGGYGLGYALDRWLGTDYLRIVFLLVGVVGGFVQLIRELMKDNRNE
jgi:F0F1-type ATP synthase assembly protein I